MKPQDCQIHGWAHVSEGSEWLALPITTRLRLTLKRLIPFQTRTRMKRRLMALLMLRKKVNQTSVQEAALSAASNTSAIELKAGDMVRIRSLQEIEATLNFSRELNGCAFIPEMIPYCGTTQRVFKPVRRFVDERDYQVKRTRGLVLLDGLICQGTSPYGPCDRSCLYFWRTEWLEKLDS